jgi:hypothetical protein
VWVYKERRLMMNGQIVSELGGMGDIDIESLRGVGEKKSNKFADRFVEMGLSQNPEGVYTYQDRFGKVQYKKLQTVEKEIIPYLGIFTLPVSATYVTPEFIGTVSELYQFVGHEAVNMKIREMVSEAQTPIFREHAQLSSDIAEMLNSVVIRNAKAVPRFGDIYPQLVVVNSYNGHKAVTVSFGFWMASDRNTYGIALRNKLGTLRQVHLLSSKGKLVSAVSQFVQIFNDNILNTIETNFNNPVSEEDFLSVLDMVEEIGKKKREAVSTYISENVGTSINSWNLFNVLCKFSAIEKNLNTRTLIENIAEKVLILPVEFSQMMQKISGR